MCNGVSNWAASFTWYLVIGKTTQRLIGAVGPRFVFEHVALSTVIRALTRLVCFDWAASPDPCVLGHEKIGDGWERRLTQPLGRVPRS